MIRQRDFITHDDETHDDGTWAISYGDMLTLLVAFFILFFSTDAKKEQEGKLLDSLVMELKPSNDEGLKESPTGIGESFKKIDSEELDVKILQEFQTEVNKVGNKVFVEFPQVSFFHSGQIELTAKGKSTLKRFSQLYTPYAGKHVVNIIGFTDPEPVTRIKGRRFQDNLELSVLRSVAAQRILQKEGIPIGRTRLGGFGVYGKQLEEIASRKNREKEYAFSRRVVLVIEPEGQI